MRAAAGIVRIHAQTIRVGAAPPHHERRVVAPDATTLAPVIAGGVLTGIPATAVAVRIRDPAVAVADASPTQPEPRDPLPMVSTIRQIVDEARPRGDQPEHWPYRGRAIAPSSPRRRARHHSTPIGITDSTMTTPITMWM